MPRHGTTNETTDTQQYFRIGEVAERVGVKPYVLRYWESEFQWLAPEKSRMKQRLYSRQDLHLVELIERLLHKERYTIQGARKVISDLKGNWSSALEALQNGIAPVGGTGKTDDTKAGKSLEKKLQATEKDLLKKVRSLKDLKAAHSDLTRELVHERQRVARLLEEMQGIQTERDRLADELQERPKGDPEFFNLLKRELEELANTGESDAAAGPALQSAE
jgi:DNA-binding transcriptional MerR regulator